MKHAGAREEIAVVHNAKDRTAKLEFRRAGGLAVSCELPLAQYKALKATLGKLRMAKDTLSADHNADGFYLDDGKGQLRSWSHDVSMGPLAEEFVACLRTLQKQHLPADATPWG